MFEVGGCVRDEILGLKSKDIDFSVVIPEGDLEGTGLNPFAFMRIELQRMGFTIFVEHEEHLTIRAKFPKDHRTWAKLDADFVLARKESGYTDGRRPDRVEVGTLMDDLARRDFTMNAIAKDAQGNLIDPFNGRADISAGIIRAVGNARDRILGEDALRGLRAMRFAIQKGFVIDPEVSDVLGRLLFKDALRSVSTERQKDELEKMFKVDTVKTLAIISRFGLEKTLFDNTGLRLMPTMKG
jgi:tRNA nucleotidyltransferase (CCA-adding enzyme)